MTSFSALIVLILILQAFTYNNVSVCLDESFKAFRFYVENVIKKVGFIVKISKLLHMIALFKWHKWLNHEEAETTEQYNISLTTQVTTSYTL